MRRADAVGGAMVVLLAAAAAVAQDAASDADRAATMRALGITALVPGASGDPADPGHANEDEALANPHGALPDPLRLGRRHVSTAAQWPRRRAEIAELLSREVYGRVPAGLPPVRWAVTGIRANATTVTRTLVGTLDNRACPAIAVALRMTVVLPVRARGRVPVLVMFRRPDLPVRDPREGELTAAGWGHALLDPVSVQADNGGGLRRGIIGFAHCGAARRLDEWGVLRAWAWGASRALDRLAADPAVDANRIGIEGVSRYGKAALVAMAFDRRFAIGLIGSSGKGGATPLRRVFGEAVESLTTGEYHWMAGNFLKYDTKGVSAPNLDAGDLPVDSNALIALAAPRPLFISYGVPAAGDATWLDQRGSWMATVSAAGVYRLLGAAGPATGDPMRTPMPTVNEGRLAGALAWRQHDGGHTDAPNMAAFLGWAARMLPPRR